MSASFGLPDAGRRLYDMSTATIRCHRLEAPLPPGLPRMLSTFCWSLLLPLIWGSLGGWSVPTSVVQVCARVGEDGGSLGAQWDKDDCAAIGIVSSTSRIGDAQRPSPDTTSSRAMASRSILPRFLRAIDLSNADESRHGRDFRLSPGANGNPPAPEAVTFYDGRRGRVIDPADPGHSLPPYLRRRNGDEPIRFPHRSPFQFSRRRWESPFSRSN